MDGGDDDDIRVEVDQFSKDAPHARRIRRANALRLDGERIQLNNDDDDDDDSTPGCLSGKVAFWTIFFVSYAIATLIAFLILFFGYREKKTSGIHIWIWTIWIGVLGASALLIRAIIQIISSVIARYFFFSKTYYYIADLGNCVSLLIWVIIMWPIWNEIVSIPEDAYVYERITHAWESLTVISVFYVFKILLDKLIVSRINPSNFWTVLWESLKKEKVLKTLANAKDVSSDPKTKPSPKDIQKAWFFINNSQENELQRTIKYNTTVLTEQADSLAEVIFRNVDQNKDGRITLEDMRPFFGENDRQYAFELLDRGKRGYVTKKELAITLRGLLKSRKFLYDTLHDRDSIGGVVSRVIGVFFWIIMAVITLVIFGFDVQKVFLPFATFILAFTFVFGNSLKSLWEAAIFIFVIRPYDVGDRVQFNSDVYETISRINLLTTEAYSREGKLLIHQHSQLYSVPITQLSRSKDYIFSATLEFSSRTTREQLEQLAAKLTVYLNNNENPRWKPETFNWGINALDKQTSIGVWFWVEINEVIWADIASWWSAKSSILLELKKSCTELGIVYFPAPQEVILLDKKRQ